MMSADTYLRLNEFEVDEFILDVFNDHDTYNSYARYKIINSISNSFKDRSKESQARSILFLSEQFDRETSYRNVMVIDQFLVSVDPKHGKSPRRLAMLQKYYRKSTPDTPLVKQHIEAELAKIGLDPETMLPAPPPVPPTLPAPPLPAPAP